MCTALDLIWLHLYQHYIPTSWYGWTCTECRSYGLPKCSIVFTDLEAAVVVAITTPMLPEHEACVIPWRGRGVRDTHMLNFQKCLIQTEKYQHLHPPDQKMYILRGKKFFPRSSRSLPPHAEQPETSPVRLCFFLGLPSPGTQNWGKGVLHSDGTSHIKVLLYPALCCP